MHRHAIHRIRRRIEVKKKKNKKEKKKKKKKKEKKKGQLYTTYRVIQKNENSTKIPRP